MTRSKPPRSASHQPAGSRRTYTKSRNGCLICKQRRVKCDETRPRCRKCEYGSRPCKYATEDKGFEPTPALTTTPDSSSTPSCSCLTLNEGPVEKFGTSGPFHFIHMQLLHHAYSHLNEFVGIQCNKTPIIDVIMENADRESYALDQLLALSALHLSAQSPAGSAMYAQHATELQTRALSAFNQVRGGVSNDNYLKVFLFSTLLGIHVLHDSLSTSGENLGSFVQKFIDYMWLHRGVRTVIANHWQRILKSRLGPLVDVSQFFGDIERTSFDKETIPLSDFLTSKCETPSPAIDACLTALRRIQGILNIIKTHPSREDFVIQGIVAWPIIVSEVYIEAMYQHRPEAFAVFAYWSALVHRHRDCWVLEEGGRDLVKMIVQHIGPYWTDALWWPIQETNEDGIVTPATSMS